MNKKHSTTTIDKTVVADTGESSISLDVLPILLHNFDEELPVTLFLKTAHLVNPEDLHLFIEEEILSIHTLD